MRIIRFDDLPTFARQVTPLLTDREAENCFLLGRIGDLSDADADATEPPPLMWAAESPDGRIVAGAMMSPRRASARQHPVVLTRASADAVRAMVAFFQEHHVDPPGISAPVPTVDDFAEAWCQRAGCGRRLVHGLGLYRLTRVIPPPPPGGTFRAASAGDATLLAAWADAFFRVVVEPETAEFCERVVADRIRGGRVFLWCDPHPVCMAGWAGRTPNGVRLNFVYTPPAHRRRGYATACVAALSQHLLDAGRRFCTLFTDLANPTTNRIYQSIGYEHVCDFRHVDFVTAR